MNYFLAAGINRDDIWVTNICKCPQYDFGNPAEEQVHYCADGWVARELRHVQPEIVITLGAMACHEMFPDCDLELEHGLPREARYKDWEGVHVPLYHPAAGMHSEEFMVPIRTDFLMLRRILRGEYTRPVDEFPVPYYREIQSTAELSVLLHKYRSLGWPEIFTDTEVLEMVNRTPWGLSFTALPGEGYVIRAGRKDVVRGFAEFVRDEKPLIGFHNYLFDVGVLEKMGVVVPAGDNGLSRFTDTMQLAYVLGNMPQGLKALAYRECGMVMQDFEDLVLPYSKKKLLRYLEIAATELQPTVKEVKPCGCSKVMAAFEKKLDTTAKALTRKSKPITEDAAWEKLSSARSRYPWLDEAYAVEMEDGLLLWERVEGKGACPYCLAGEHALRTIKGADKTLLGAYRKVSSLISAIEGVDGVPNPKLKPWKRWKEWEEGEKEAIRVLAEGDIPQPSIADVPDEKAVYYSARDADATCRVQKVLRRRAVERRREVAG